ncbi:MAG TPA: arginine--tRNA ligase [archaeon]|nr:arginine--tRNA ligase [archaeon]
MINFKEEFANCLSKTIDRDKQEIIRYIELPPDSNLGNLSFPCFSLAKDLKKSPIDIAKDLKDKLHSDIFIFSEINGYVNAMIKQEILYKETITEILEKKKNYGRIIKEKKEQFIIDTFNANTFKTLHVGHLRMIVGGNAIDRLLEFSGEEPISVYYGGDVGTHVAKWYWYYSKFLSPVEQKIPKKDVAKWFGQIYLRAGEKAKEIPESTKEISDIQKQILTDKELKEKIKKLRDESFNAYMQVKDELEINLKDKFFESETEQKFLEIKDSLFQEYKALFKESQEAVIADLKDQKLDVVVLIKHNGAPLYAAKDIALVKVKKERYPNANNFLYVVGSEQDFYLRQMFYLFSKIYPQTNHKHLSLGMVNLTTGKMASREGEMVLYEDFRDMLKKRAEEILIENNLEVDDKIVSAIVYGTIKFEMLKINFNKTFVFDINSALDLQGDSSVYVQYSGVRAKSILRKIKEENFPKKLNLCTEEKKLLDLLYQFPDKVKFSAQEYKPNTIAGYCLELSHAFNKFYVNCPVISSDLDLQNQRVFLIRGYLVVLENALGILGIKIPERM